MAIAPPSDHTRRWNFDRLAGATTTRRQHHPGERLELRKRPDPGRRDLLAQQQRRGQGHQQHDLQHLRPRAGLRPLRQLHHHGQHDQQAGLPLERRQQPVRRRGGRCPARREQVHDQEQHLRQQQSPLERRQRPQPLHSRQGGGHVLRSARRQQDGDRVHPRPAAQPGPPGQRQHHRGQQDHRLLRAGEPVHRSGLLRLPGHRVRAEQQLERQHDQLFTRATTPSAPRWGPNAAGPTGTPPRPPAPAAAHPSRATPTTTSTTPRRGTGRATIPAGSIDSVRLS